MPMADHGRLPETLGAYRNARPSRMKWPRAGKVNLAAPQWASVIPADQACPDDIPPRLARSTHPKGKCPAPNRNPPTRRFRAPRPHQRSPLCGHRFHRGPKDGGSPRAQALPCTGFCPKPMTIAPEWRFCAHTTQLDAIWFPIGPTIPGPPNHETKGTCLVPKRKWKASRFLVVPNPRPTPPRPPPPFLSRGRTHNGRGQRAPPPPPVAGLPSPVFFRRSRPPGTAYVPSIVGVSRFHVRSDLAPQTILLSPPSQINQHPEAAGPAASFCGV